MPGGCAFVDKDGIPNTYTLQRGICWGIWFDILTLRPPGRSTASSADTPKGRRSDAACSRIRHGDEVGITAKKGNALVGLLVQERVADFLDIEMQGADE